MHIPKLNAIRPSLLSGAVAAMLALAACCNGGASSSPPIAGSVPPKNVIIMINDGASAGTWEMSAYWQKGVRINELDAYKSLPVRLGMTTFPLNTSQTPTNDNVAKGRYDATQAWDTARGKAASEQNSATFLGYAYLKSNVTDSAAAATAMASGTKTYNNAINYDNNGRPLEFITQIARAQGKATGVITTVQFSHATPAAFSAQNLSRKNMTAIAADMLTNGQLDLLMGTGHPEYDGNGVSVITLNANECAANPACKAPYDTIGEAQWKALKAGTLVPHGSSRAWSLIENKASFEALAAGDLTVKSPLIGIPQVRWTLQQGREAAVLGADPRQPSGVRMIPTLPDLATMTHGALNHLGRNRKGLFLMIEGGATDWAAHANQTGRVIEEALQFHRAVATVQAWVERNSSWDETLLIVTTDHGNGLPLGEESDAKAFEQVKNNGAGVLPGVRFWSKDHTNEVVRLWARGRGSDKLIARVRGKDASFARIVGHNTDGSYIDNTDVFAVMKAGLGK